MREKADNDEVEWGYHPVGAPGGDKSTSNSWQNDVHSTVIYSILLSLLGGSTGGSLCPPAGSVADTGHFECAPPPVWAAHTPHTAPSST